MRDSDAIISRGFALNFFVRGSARSMFLDVFVQRGQPAEHFLRYLEGKELYTISSVQDANDGQSQDIHDITVLQNPERRTTKNNNPPHSNHSVSSRSGSANFIDDSRP
ncbi:hypothetical protein CGMCC3_g15866 [Colletotrichum fructicola]|nr:uncharacterized protein CGMCC3_g15866 [Colletotrichum fructicola]KAE9568026.1 hypothetical protein CGMCC3_g15866 [Colletotrichum fructicola]